VDAVRKDREGRKGEGDQKEEKGRSGVKGGLEEKKG